MSDIKNLLEKWATLEPTLCKRETRPNPFKFEEIERFDIFTSYGWQTVYSHENYYDEYNSPMKIQWAVQQAIIEKGWWLEMHYTPSGYNEAIVMIPSKTRAKGYSQNNLAEALLDSYLKVLDANP